MRRCALELRGAAASYADRRRLVYPASCKQPRTRGECPPHTPGIGGERGGEGGMCQESGWHNAFALEKSISNGEGRGEKGHYYLNLIQNPSYMAFHGGAGTAKSRPPAAGRVPLPLARPPLQLSSQFRGRYTNYQGTGESREKPCGRGRFQ